MGTMTTLKTCADRYDAWYDTPKGRVLLALESACLKPLLQRFPRPYLEVGVGTGRFAQALGIQYGIDPSPRALDKALPRGVRALLGVGEALPFRRATFGAVLMAFTLCFVEDPSAVMREIRRVLCSGGGLVLGLLLRGTPWANFYEQRGREGDPLFSTAHFYLREEVDTMLKESGFCVTSFRSTLFQPPGLKVYREEAPVDGYAPGAGFVAIAALKAG
jgi:SAM-dependent methyltransferase